MLQDQKVAGYTIIGDVARQAGHLKCDWRISVSRDEAEGNDIKIGRSCDFCTSKMKLVWKQSI